MLRCSIFLLSVVVAVVQSKAQYYDPYYQPYAYPYVPYQGGYRQSPAAYYPDGNRLLWNVLISTTTTTTTCTISTTACSGRRKRFLIGDMEENDAIQPSAVNKVETTPVADMTNRKEREANPQYAFVRGSPQGAYPIYEIEPTFGQNYFFYSSPEQFYNRQPINAADPRWGFYISTSTSTVTSSSTPSCSSSSSFNQC